MAKSSGGAAAAGGGGIGLLGMVFVVFLVLKLAEVGQVAHWSWWWVTAPLWGPLALVFGIVAAVALVFVAVMAVVLFCRLLALPFKRKAEKRLTGFQRVRAAAEAAQAREVARRSVKPTSEQEDYAASILLGKKK